MQTAKQMGVEPGRYSSIIGTLVYVLRFVELWKVSDAFVHDSVVLVGERASAEDGIKEVSNFQVSYGNDCPFYDLTYALQSA